MSTIKQTRFVCPVVILGDAQPGGVYLLRLHIHQPLAIVCGRFKGGKPLNFAPGTYVYIGSALSVMGAATLARRLVRHATRSGERPPHALRAQLIERLNELGLGGAPSVRPAVKKLFWHVDYLLDELAVELRQIIALCTVKRLEAGLGQLLNVDPCTFVVEKGLGASDYRGATHLLGVNAAEDWWAALPERVRRQLE